MKLVRQKEARLPLIAFRGVASNDSVLCHGFACIDAFTVMPGPGPERDSYDEKTFQLEYGVDGIEAPDDQAWMSLFAKLTDCSIVGDCHDVLAGVIRACPLTFCSMAGLGLPYLPLHSRLSKWDRIEAAMGL